MAGEHDIGGVVGHLRLDRSSWSAAIEAAKKQATDLSRVDPKISVTVEGTAKALAELESVAAASKRLQDAQGKVALAQGKLDDLQASAGGVATPEMSRKIQVAEQNLAKATRDVELSQIRVANAYQQVDAEANKVEDGTKRVEKSMRSAADNGAKPLVEALLLLGPALVPLGAAGGAVAGGLALGLAAAAVGVLGVKRQMQEGTDVGKQYTAGLKSLTGNFNALEATGATALITSFNKGVQLSSRLFPLLNQEVGQFAAKTGDAAYHLTSGLITGFVTLRPLLTEVINGVDHGAASFDKWTQSTGGISKFMAYAQVELPKVGATLSNLVTTVSHLVQGLAPLGEASLSSLGVLSRVINMIPVGVLQEVIPLIVGLRLGMKGLDAANGASSSIAAFSTKLEGSASVVSKASGFVGKLGSAVKFLGPVGVAAGIGFGIMSDLMGNNAQKAAEDASRVNDLTTALQNGTAAATVYAQLLKSGALQAGQKIGIDPSDLVSAVTGSGGKLDGVNAKIATLAATYKTLNERVHEAAGNPMGGAPTKALINQWQQTGSELDHLQGGLKTAQADYENAKTAAANFAAASGDSALASQISSGAYLAVAKTLGLTGDEYLNARLAADKQAQSTQAATAAMVLENNAAGLLNQALNSLAGQNLSVAQAQTALDSAVLTGDATLAKNKGTVNEHTQAGLDDRQAIEGMASALRGKATADAAAGLSTEQVTAKYRANSKSILDNIAKFDGDKTAADRARDAAYQYAKKLLEIPPVVSTEFDITARISQILISATAAGQGAHNAKLNSGRAGGGPVSDGITPVGENGMEYLDKRGPQLRVLTMSQARSSGITGPGVGSPAARAVSASYTTPAPQSGPTVVHLTSYTQIDGRTITTKVDEYHLQDQR